jgi:glycosyltransferase involved in cell wall biosynthesis
MPMARSNNAPAARRGRRERPLRVWILNHYAALPDASAGTRHFDLAVRMRERGIATTIFASGFSHFTQRNEKTRGLVLRRSEVVDGVRFVWLRTVPYRTNGALRVLNMLSYFGAVLVAQFGEPRPDVVVGSSVHPLAALAGRLIAWRHHVPFVFEIRDLWPQTLIEMGAISEAGVAARAMRRIERLLVRDADAVISLIPGLNDYLRSRGLKPRRLVYIPNGASPAVGRTSQIPPDLDVALGRWRNEGSVIFAYVGAHGAANGLETVLEAACLLRTRGRADCKVLLVGGGPEKPRLVSMARDLELDNVLLVAPVPKQVVPELLGRVDVGLFHLRPNGVFRYGISSNKLFDYMAGALPIISASATSYDPVALADAGVSIEPDDGHGLAEAMMSMASATPAERAAMGGRGMTYLAREHDLDSLAGRFADLLIGLDGDPVVATGHLVRRGR